MQERERECVCVCMCVFMLMPVRVRLTLVECKGEGLKGEGNVSGSDAMQSDVVCDGSGDDGGVDSDDGGAGEGRRRDVSEDEVVFTCRAS